MSRRNTLMWLLTTLLSSGCAQHENYIQGAQLIPMSRPIPGDYALGRPVHAHECDTAAKRVDVQAMIREAQGTYDALVQITLISRRELEYVSVGLGERQLTGAVTCIELDAVGATFQDESLETDPTSGPAADQVTTSHPFAPVDNIQGASRLRWFAAAPQGKPFSTQDGLDKYPGDDMPILNLEPETVIIGFSDAGLVWFRARFPTDVTEQISEALGPPTGHGAVSAEWEGAQVKATLTAGQILTVERITP